MRPEMAPLAAQARLHRRLFVNVLDGLDDQTAQRRVGDTTNHVTFLAAHLTEAREYLLELLGGDKRDPFPELGQGEGIEDFDQWPTLERIRAAWEDVTERLEARLPQVEAADLERPLEQPGTVEPPTVAGFAAFLLHHEAYHLGQIALLRKHWGLPAMRYD